MAGQLTEAAQTLTDAIALGVDSPLFRIELAEFYRSTDPGKASEHAFAVHAQAQESPAIRLKAIQLMLQLGKQATAWQLLVPEFPETVTDTDADFDVLTAGVLAAGDDRDQQRIMDSIAPLAARSGKWLGLWITMTRMQSTTVSSAERWLKQAEQFAIDLAGSRRQIASGWRSLAVRTKNHEYFRRGIHLIQSADEQTAEDMIATGRLLQKCARNAEALEAYQNAAAAADTDRVRAIALNSVARMELETGDDLQHAEESVRKAMTLTEHPSLAVTLANIQLKQGADQKALATLNDNLTKFPGSIELRILLCELLIRSDRRERAGRIAAEIVRLTGNARLGEETQERFQKIQATLGDARQSARETRSQL